MSGGGKTQTATQQVQIPPEVMARYNAVNKRAETAAAQPFQAYSQDPSAFVAPLTQTQQSAIQNINQAAGMTQPYFQTAAGLTLGGAQGVGPLTQQQIGYYQNPFTQSVVGSTLAGLQQQQGQQLAQQQAEAIKAGAFGGDRAGIQRAQLQGQQNLATAQAISPLMMQGYQQGVQTAMGQQNVLAQDLQRQLAAGQQLGGLGAQSQQAALAGAQAQLGAGTAEQQTEQAGKQALYNQFLQERGYPFQVAQFLANIAMGTGALSGSTTATTQPAPFFSDEREKTNIQPLGDGLYAYDYTADIEAAEREGRPMPPKRVGPMAQDIEERAPGLVGEVNGHKVVDMNSMGGLVGRSGAYASGGAIVAPADMQAILAAIGQPLAFYGGRGGAGLGSGGVGAAGYIPQSQVAQPKLVTAGGLPQQGPSGLSSALDTGSKIAGLAKTGRGALTGSPATRDATASRGLFGSGGEFNKSGFLSGLGGGEAGPSRAAPPAPKGADKIAEAMPQAEWDISRSFGYRGGLMRNDYAMGGALPYATGDMGEDPLQKIGEPDEQKRELMTPGKLGAPAPGLGNELLDAGSKIASIAKVAMMFAPSDARMKDNIEPVGELYDGQPIYRYNMKGSPKTQIGLMAQDLEHNGHGDAVAGLGGLKMVDYKRATDVAAGLAPRQGYQSGGSPDVIEGPVIDFERLEAPTPPRDERKYTPEALRGLVREYGQELRERRPGFDPEFAERVFQGESGFDPRAVGDDGSSFGVPQLHMGSISAKYPNPGLGDEFMRDTGLDPRDPRNARAMTAWSMDYAAEKGWRPWTVARKLKEQDAGGGAPASGVAGGERSARPVSAGMDASEAPYATLFGGAFGGLDPRTQQALTSESFWVPALAGLGSMLSSKSPYLLGAVGEGLVGGTGAYTALQKQSADILKQRFDIARNVFRGPVMNKDGQFVWEDTRTGEMLTQAEYQQRYNAFLTGRSGSAAPSTRAAEPRPGAEAVRTAREVIAAPAPAPIPAPAPAPPVSDDMPATPVPSGAPPAAATAPATPPAAAEPNVAQMRQRALENQALWSNTDPSMNPRVLLPQVNRLDGQIKELEGRADEVSRLATAAAERNPQQGTIYQNQAQSLYAQAGKLREEMRDKLARANQSLDAAVQLDVKAAEARQTGTIQREFKEEISPDGTKISLAPGTRLPPPVAPQPTRDQLLSPAKAQIDLEGNIILAQPQAPAGGGLILPDLPPGAKVTELSPVAKNQIEVDGQFQKDFMEKAPSIGQARQRYMGLINAFKLFESGSTASTRAGWAAVAETFGYPDIARSIINGEPAGAQWVEKIGPNLVLDTLKAATPRFAQSEFVTLQDKGTPEPNKLPQTNFQMVKEGLALLNRSEAFIRSWDRASREEGWRSPSAYYSAWGQANPLSKFEESVELQMGNFRGMPLPSSDKWVPGTIYTAPSNLPAAQRDALARFGVKPGEPFQYLGRDVPADQRIRRLDPRQLYSIPAMGQ